MTPSPPYPPANFRASIPLARNRKAPQWFVCALGAAPIDFKEPCGQKTAPNAAAADNNQMFLACVAADTD
jgi:hypothetical protein